jgi:hypothetical protein
MRDKALDIDDAAVALLHVLGNPARIVFVRLVHPQFQEPCHMLGMQKNDRKPHLLQGMPQPGGKRFVSSQPSVKKKSINSGY